MHRRRKIEVFEMMCLSNISRIRRVDRVRNAIIRERCRCELSVLERIERVKMVQGCGKNESKGWLKECIGQMWRVTGGEGDCREDEGIK